jgi:hypothetical protein
VKLYTYGTGVIAANPLAGKWVILGAGYPELLAHLSLAGGGSVPIEDNQLNYVSTYVPGALGLPGIEHAGLSDADLAQIKAAIDGGKIALSQAQVDALTAAVAQGAKDGGEAGAKAAIKGLTFVAKAG